MKRFVSIEASKLERFEKLEQLRALENKIDIFVGIVNTAPISIDVQNDLKKLLESIKIKRKDHEY